MKYLPLFLNNIVRLVYYSKIAANISSAFNNYLYNSGVICGGTQTAQALPIYFGISEPQEIPLVLDVLVENINSYNGHLTTGIFGLEYMFSTLSNNDYNDLAYQIATQVTYPSYGYMLENGATTIWESWFIDNNTYSQNHAMFGAVGMWFYEALAGIRPQGSLFGDANICKGFNYIIIKPQPAGDLTFVKATYNSINGQILSSWKLEEGYFYLNVSIPVNTKSSIYVPFTNPVVLNTKLAPSRFRIHRLYNIETEYNVGSGYYYFKSKI